MADSNDGGNSEGLRAFLGPVLTLILGALLVTQIDWDHKRPAPDKDSSRRAGIQLDARLWMDPLEPPRRDQADKFSHATGGDDFGGQIVRHLTDPDNTCGRVRFLAVMLDGGPFAESTERRRRIRYAVLSGLIASEFAYRPEDRDHIRYLRLDKPYDYYDPRHEPRVLSTAERQMPEVIPYEWFQSGNPEKPGCPVLVLWLDEGQMSEWPLQKLLVIKNLMRLYPIHALYAQKDKGKAINRQKLLAQQLTALILGNKPDGYEKWFNGLMARLGQKPPDAAILAEWLRLLETAWDCNHESAKPSDSASGGKPRQECEQAFQVERPDKAARSAALKAPPANSGARTGQKSWDLPPHSYLFQVLGARASAEVVTELGDWLSKSLRGQSAARVVNPDAYDFRILGPASSDTLRAMVIDLDSQGFKPVDRQAKGKEEAQKFCRPDGPDAEKPGYIFKILSPTASTEAVPLLKSLPPSHFLAEKLPPRHSPPESRSVDDLGSAAQASECIEGAFKASGIFFKPTILTDGELARAIVDELAKRGLKTAIGPEAESTAIEDHVALVFESDTTYARNLKESFMTRLCENDSEGKKLTGSALERCRKRRDNLSFSYFQGLDGEGVAKPKFNNGRESAAKNNNGPPSTVDDLVQLAKPLATKASFADDQTDYLERIALDIEIHDGRLHSHRQAVRAIGLLGGDVFDKIQLLTALRPRFPEAVFFTTELDGRYVDGTPSPLIARNLVVVSSFDLELEQSAQKFIPRFRSSEQTAYFDATLHALEDRTPTKRMKPRLFEVGRTVLFPLAAEKGGRECPNDSKDTAGGSDPESYDIPVGRCQVEHLLRHRWAPVLVVSAAGLYLLFRSTRRENRGLAGILMVVGLLGLILLGWGISNSVEPFAWLEGVSIWPTEFIRLGTILLGLHFLSNQYRQRDRLKTKPGLGKVCNDGNPPDFKPLEGLNRYIHPIKDAVQIIKSNWKIIGYALILTVLGLFVFWLYFTYRHSGGNWITLGLAMVSLGLIAFTFWKREGNGAEGIEKVWAYAPLLLTVSLSLMALFHPPTVPCRDVWSCIIDRLFLGTTIIIFLLLLSTALAVAREVHAWLLENEPKVREMKSPELLAMAIDRIGHETQKVQALVVKPFVIAALMLVSRNRVFDNWVLSPGLLAIFLFSFGLMALCSYGVWEPASRIRENKRKELRKARRMSELDIDKALQSHEGAYGGILNGPILKGAMLLAGGAGLEPLLAKILDFLG